MTLVFIREENEAQRSRISNHGRTRFYDQACLTPKLSSNHYCTLPLNSVNLIKQYLFGATLSKNDV